MKISRYFLCQEFALVFAHLSGDEGAREEFHGAYNQFVTKAGNDERVAPHQPIEPCLRNFKNRAAASRSNGRRVKPAKKSVMLAKDS